jgi:hypothetical protein
MGSRDHTHQKQAYLFAGHSDEDTRFIAILRDRPPDISVQLRAGKSTGHFFAAYSITVEKNISDVR